MSDLNQMPWIISVDVNIEERNNVNSRNVNINNVNCTDKSHQDNGLINCTYKNRKGQAESYCTSEKYFHMCRVAERGVDKFKMCTNCLCLLLQQRLLIKRMETA